MAGDQKPADKPADNGAPKVANVPPESGPPQVVSGDGKKVAGRYRLKADVGAHYGDDGKKVEPGDVVELTEAQAKAFGDKFDPA